MKNNPILPFMAICIALTLFTFGCNPATDTASKAAEATKEAAKEAAKEMPAKPDMGKVKAEIQALESAWAAADNARDAAAISAFYADDAISMSNNNPMLVGKAAILKDIEAGLAKRQKGATVSYDIMDVFGDENTVTEVGKTTSKDAAGKVLYTGKYMAIWEKRNGKWLAIRDIYNDDVKEK